MAGTVIGEELTIEGEITSDEEVVIRSGSLLHGEVKGAEVAIEPGARVSIRLDTPFELNI